MHIPHFIWNALFNNILSDEKGSESMNGTVSELVCRIQQSDRILLGIF